MSHKLNTDYREKEFDYFSSVRNDVIKFLPKSGVNRVLEVGAGTSDTLIAIKSEGLSKEVYGVELNNIDSTKQEQNPDLDGFIIGDIEEIELPYPAEYFDAIICSDVLEHLSNPWEVVDKLYPLIKKDGLFIISVPNIRDISTLFKILILGDFRYDPQGGVLDKTHLRFFCKKNAVELLTRDYSVITECKPSMTYREWGFNKNRRHFLNLISFGLFEQFLSTQYIVVAKKVHSLKNDNNDA